MKGILEQALSAYEILGKALGEYLLKLQEGDLYWAYENAIRRHPPAGRLDWLKLFWKRGLLDT